MGNSSTYAAVYSLAENALTDAQIWAPLNGELIVYASNVFDDTYSDSNVRYISNTTFYGNDSAAIIFDCGGKEMYNDDASSRSSCNQNTFFSALGEYLEFNCLYGANCSYNTLYCPQEIEYGVACQIIFDDSVATSNTYFTRNGINEVSFLFALW